CSPPAPFRRDPLCCLPCLESLLKHGAPETRCVAACLPQVITEPTLCHMVDIVGLSGRFRIVMRGRAARAELMAGAGHQGTRRAVVSSVDCPESDDLQEW